MQNAINLNKNKKYKNLFSPDNESDFLVDSDSYNKEFEIDIDNQISMFKSEAEDASSFLENLFLGKRTILNENWVAEQAIQGIITCVDDQNVYVDCLIDFGNKVIQNRIFSRYLFENLLLIETKTPVIIKTRQKPGSIRIDVYPGKGIVDMDYFVTAKSWDSLKGKNLDKKLTKW